MAADFEPLLIGAPQQPAKSLVVIFHGYGSCAEKYEATGPVLQETLPATDVLCLNGPIKVVPPPGHPVEEGDPPLRSWIQFGGLGNLAKLSLRLAFNRLSVIDDINAVIDNELEKRNLSDDRLALFGFSMGAGIALMAGYARSEKCAAIVSHSGVYLQGKSVVSRPDTLMLIGDKDFLYDIPRPPQKTGFGSTAFYALARKISFNHSYTLDRLRDSNIAFEEKIVPGLEHAITPETIRETATFLKNRLG